MGAFRFEIAVKVCFSFVERSFFPQGMLFGRVVETTSLEREQFNPHGEWFKQKVWRYRNPKEDALVSLWLAVELGQLAKMHGSMAWECVVSIVQEVVIQVKDRSDSESLFRLLGIIKLGVAQILRENRNSQ